MDNTVPDAPPPERVCVKCQRPLRPTEPMLGEGFCRDCAPSLDPDSTQSNTPLTDAEVDDFLEAHKDHPVDEEQADRIEWLFREKLATDARMAMREWIDEYDRQSKESGTRIARDLERLYGGTKSLIENALRVIETLAIRPPRADIAARSPTWEDGIKRGREQLAAELLGQLDRCSSTTAAFHLVKSLCLIESGINPNTLGALNEKT